MYDDDDGEIEIIFEHVGWWESDVPVFFEPFMAQKSTVDTFNFDDYIGILLAEN